jgi:hypothetical protein
VALDKTALTTLSTVKEELGSPSGQDSTLERYIRQASDLFRQLTGRQWYDIDGYQERVAGYQGKRLAVYDHLPVESVNKIEIQVDGAFDEVDPTAYEIEDAESGFIRRIDGGSWELTESFIQNIEPQFTGENLKLYRVDYDGGYVTPEDADQNNKTRDLPYDIEDAVIDLVVDKFRKKGQSGNVSSESIMSVSIDYDTTTDMEDVINGTTPAFSRTVKQYRNPKTLIA